MIKLRKKLLVFFKPKTEDNILMAAILILYYPLENVKYIVAGSLISGASAAHILHVSVIAILLLVGEGN